MFGRVENFVGKGENDGHQLDHSCILSMNNSEIDASVSEVFVQKQCYTHKDT